MTLCVAWIRKAKDNDELIFATDSCLSGGERWNYGVKLFELPRRDCLICFAGETNRTYPLILNLISSIKYDEVISNPNTDIQDVLDHITTLFTNLCNEIFNFTPQTFEQAIGEFSFLFGGWSWKNSELRLWKLEYSKDAKAFLYKTDYDDMVFTFIGDEIEKARSLLIQEIQDNDRILSGRLDMEPLTVLLKMIRDNLYDSIDGAIQLAKIYPPGTTEFFGVMWHNEKGKKTFLGRDVSSDNNPLVRFIDPETAEIIGDIIPEQLKELSEDIFGIHYKFVSECYPNQMIKENLKDNERKRLKYILQEIAYTKFIAENNIYEQEE